MEKIIINNFLSIQSAEIEIKKFNILIGPQAQGKSIIAKLVSFFKGFPDFISELTRENNNDLSQQYIDKKYQELFGEIFSKASWGKQKFDILYENDFFSIIIKNDEKLKFIYPKEIINVFHQLKSFKKKSVKLPEDLQERLLKQVIDENKGIFEDMQNIVEGDKKQNKDKIKVFFEKMVKNAFEQTIYKSISADMVQSILIGNKNKGQLVQNITYIPDKRSLFSELEINSFLLLKSDLQLSYYLQDFFTTYQAIQQVYKKSFVSCEFMHKEIDQLVSSILKGYVEFRNNKIWIRDKRVTISVQESSSGQQEVLPMLLVLLFPTLKRIGDKNQQNIYIIEEPEAHLFPTAQKDFVSLLAILLNDFNYVSQYIITTHSPYILSYMNNLLHAGNILKQYPDKKEEIIKIVPESEILSYEDVSVYLINDGMAKSILDEEMQLIDAGLMDAVSNNIMEEFEQLVSL